MAKLIYDFVEFDAIAPMDLGGHPFLHEQGQVVLRGYVRSLEITKETWTLYCRDIESLEKFAGVWSNAEYTEPFMGPVDRTSFSICRVDGKTEFGETVNLSCYGSQFHFGALLKDPWQNNLWPALDTDYLPSDMPTSDY